MKVKGKKKQTALRVNSTLVFTNRAVAEPQTFAIYSFTVDRVSLFCFLFLCVGVGH
jgi:hypothetical protein